MFDSSNERCEYFLTPSQPRAQEKKKACLEELQKRSDHIKVPDPLKGRQFVVANRPSYSNASLLTALNIRARKNDAFAVERKRMNDLKRGAKSNAHVLPAATSRGRNRAGPGPDPGIR